MDTSIKVVVLAYTDFAFHCLLKASSRNPARIAELLNLSDAKPNPVCNFREENLSVLREIILISPTHLSIRPDEYFIPL